LDIKKGYHHVLVLIKILIKACATSSTSPKYLLLEENIKYFITTSIRLGKEWLGDWGDCG